MLDWSEEVNIKIAWIIHSQRPKAERICSAIAFVYDRGVIEQN